jgi:dolichol kinase
MSIPLENWPLLEIIRLISILVIQCTTSYLVLKRKLKVNYSRKVIHFSGLFATFFISRTFFNYSIEYFVISGVLSLVGFLIYIKPIRKRVRFVDFLFLSFDRPEDRPNTLQLVTTQVIGMTVALVGVAFLFGVSGLSLDLLALPLLVTAFGDGLAEPVGVRFGKRKFRVRDLFGNRVYTRSLEGSLMVFLSCVVVLLFFIDIFSFEAFTCLFFVLPLVMTVTEAYSPHTWDNPFLYLIGSLTIYTFVLLV